MVKVLFAALLLICGCSKPHSVPTKIEKTDSQISIAKTFPDCKAGETVGFTDGKFNCIPVLGPTCKWQDRIVVVDDYTPKITTHKEHRPICVTAQGEVRGEAVFERSTNLWVGYVNGFLHILPWDPPDHQGKKEQ